MTSEYDLLVMMTWKDDPDLPDQAKEAFRVFYAHHQNYVMKATRKACSELPYNNKTEIVNDLFNDIFKRIYEKAGTIRNAMEHHQHKNEDEFRIILRAYIGKMANTELMRYLKEEKAYREKHESLEDRAFFEPYIIPDFDEPEQEFQDDRNEMIKLTESILQQLKPMERDILITKMRYHQERKDLPDEVIREISERYGITPGYMRVIISRAKDRFTKILSEKTGLQPVPKTNRAQVHDRRLNVET